MEWASQNWIWIVVAIAALFLFRRGHGHGGLFGGGGHGSHGGLGGLLGGLGHGGHHGGHDEHEHEARGEPRPGTAIDPVSGKEVRTEHAITSYYQGQVYFFESPENRQRFEASPEQYAATRGEQPVGRSSHRGHRRRGC